MTEGMISIIIPAREEERDIEATIRQFDQLTHPHEVIVADAGSKDQTVARARGAGARIALNEGGPLCASHQRNDGGKIAQGEFLMFIDTTVMLPDVNSFVDRALSFFKRDPQFVGLGVQQYIYPQIETRSDRIILWITNRMLMLRNNILGNGCASGKFQMIRRATFEKAGGYDEKRVTGEDHEMFERLAKIGKTHVEKSLWILYAGRREHAWGWPRLLLSWMRDEAYIAMYDRPKSEDWAPMSK